MLLVWFSCSPTSAYHFSHQFFALAVILYYPDMDFETIPLFNSLIIILFSRPVSFLQTHPQDIPPSFLFNTEKHNSHDQWIPLLQIHSALTLSLSLLNSSSTPKLILFHTLSEHLQLSPLNFPSLMAAYPPIIVDVHHLFRSHLHPIYLSFLPHPCLWPKQVYPEYYPKDSFCVYHSEYPSSTFITQKLPASISKTPQTRQFNINE